MTNLLPDSPDGELTPIQYALLANSTFDWAGFVRSFIVCCVNHPEYTIRSLTIIKDNRSVLRVADRLFEDLRFRYLFIMNKAKGSFHSAPYDDVHTILPPLTASDIAFDRAIYNIFLAGPKTLERPQQITDRLLPHYQGLTGPPPYTIGMMQPEEEKRQMAMLLTGIKVVSYACNHVARRVKACCKEHGVDPEKLTNITESDGANRVKYTYKVESSDEDNVNEDGYYVVQAVV